MNTQFVYIDSISKLDPSKATVYDLNKRYIDGDGNMFGLKYNRDTKKIEVIRLLRTSMQHARMIAKKMHDKGTVQQQPHAIEKEIAVVAETQEIEASAEPEEIIPDFYISSKVNELNQFKERLKGLIRNINSTNLNSREHREISTALDEIIRNLEMDGLQKIDKVISLYRELSEYPRSINYYIGRIENRGRALLEEITADDKKMKFVLYSEMLTSLRELYGAVDKILASLNENIEHAPTEKTSHMSNAERQHFTDSKVTIDNTRKEIKNHFFSLNEFESKMYDISTYR